jgi:hypothetical protein
MNIHRRQVTLSVVWMNSKGGMSSKKTFHVNNMWVP